MRKRNVKKQFWFSSKECELLAHYSKKAGLTESEYIRELLVGYKLKEKPDDRFYDNLKILRNISNNMNQIAKKANTFGYVDELLYKKNVDKLLDFIKLFKDRHLKEEKEANYNKSSTF